MKLFLLECLFFVGSFATILNGSDVHVNGVAKFEFDIAKGWSYETVMLEDARRLAMTSERIRGGSVVNSIKEYPFMAGLYLEESDGSSLIFICSAHLTRLRGQVALTASHCILDGQAFVICAGSTDGSQPGKCTKVMNVVRHPKFDPRDLTSPDVAILELEDTLKGRGIDEIEIDFYAANYQSPKMSMIGYDPTFSGTQDIVLREAQTSLIAREQCGLLDLIKQFFPLSARREYLTCTSSTYLGAPSQACFTDSGSPLLTYRCFRGNCRYFAFGVFSFSNCGSGESIYQALNKPALFRGLVYNYLYKRSR